MSPAAVPGSRAAVPGSRAAAKTAPAAGVRLLLGPEEGDKSAFIEKIRETLSKSGEAPELTRFYAGDCRIADVLLCLRNQTLFARHRLVILANTEEVRRAEDVAALVEYAGSPASDATFLIVSSGFASEIDRRIVAAVPKDAQKIFWEMFDNQKPGWIMAFFKQKRITIAPEAAEYILDMVENNTRDMRTECERLAQFFGENASLELESVEQYIYHSKEENVFTLFERLCARELSASIEVLDTILLSREADAPQLAGGLLLQFRKLGGLKRMLADNYSAAEAYPKLRLFSKRNQKTYREGCDAFSTPDIETILQLLTAFDERFRSVRTELHGLLLHLLVYYIVRRAGQGAWRLSL